MKKKGTADGKWKGNQSHEMERAVSNNLENRDLSYEIPVGNKEKVYHDNMLKR